MSDAGYVLTVRGESELLARAQHLFESVRKEFLCAAVDLNTWSLPRGRRRVRVGVRRPPDLVVRKLFTPRVLEGEESRRQLGHIVAAGGQVRICTAPLPRETIVLDGRIAILAGAPDGAERTFRVVRDPEVVAGVRALFLAGWTGAADLSAYHPPSRPALGESGQRILALLSAGLTDETAARRLGLSVRTYRRRVAELMSLLGAESRFQAGIRAGDLGR